MDTITSHIDSIRIELTALNAVVLAILAAVAVYAAVKAYRSTIPPALGWKRTVLTILRSAVLVILLVALAEPILTIVSSLTRRSVTAVLLDTSSSMNQAGDPVRKSDASAVFETVRERLGKTGAYVSFDTDSRTLNGEPRFDGTGTDMLAALTRAAGHPDVSSIIIISDGRWNLGGDPAGSGIPGDVPIHTVMAGSLEMPGDVVISSISAPQVGHSGEPFTVELAVSSTTERPEPVPVDILENGVRIASGTVSFKERATVRTSFDLAFGSPGDHHYTVEISPSGDQYPDNNLRSFRVHVLKNNFRLLLAANSPSADFAFMRRVLEAETAFDVIPVIENGAGGDISRAIPDDLSPFDALILIDWGGVADTGTAQRIAERCARGAGLWLIGSSPPGPTSGALASLMPVRRTTGVDGSTGHFMLELTTTGRSHALTSWDTGRAPVWNNLPPLTDILSVSPTTDGAVLAQAKPFDGGTVRPAIIIGGQGAGKVLYTPFSGIWRWRLMMEGAGKDGSFYSRFVTRAVNWLTAPAKSSPLTLTTDRDVYLSGQGIEFEARLYDDVFAPVSGADIMVAVDDDPSMKIRLREIRPAVYAGTLRSPGAGIRSFTASASLNGTQYAEYRGSLTVEAFPLEMLDPSPDPDLMGMIAAKSGGVAVTPAGIDSVLSTIHPDTLHERTENALHVTLNPLIPLAIILMLVAEWTLRKSIGMI